MPSKGRAFLTRELKGERPREGVSRAHTRTQQTASDVRVVEAKDADDCSGLDGDAGLLDELASKRGQMSDSQSPRRSKPTGGEESTHLDVTGLLGDEGHDHLHDLDLGVDLAGVDVVARVDEEADDLAGRGRPQLRAVAGEEGRGRRGRESASESYVANEQRPTHGSFSFSIRHVLASTWMRSVPASSRQ